MRYFCRSGECKFGLAAASRIVWTSLQLVIGLVLFHASAAHGGESVDLTEQKQRELPKKWSGDAGVAVVSSYYAYGILLENQGAMVQPYLNVNYTAYSGNGLVRNLSVGLQLWSSIHSEETLAAEGSDFGAWSELHYYLPVTVTLGNALTLGASYLEYNSPNEGFETIRSVTLTAAYDDADQLGRFALHPRVRILYNFEGLVGVSKTNAWYFEVGVAPGYVVAEKSSFPLTFSFPINLGLGDANFYPGSAFGFASVGANCSVPLSRIPTRFGTWTVAGGITYYRLGHAPASLNVDSDRNAYVVDFGVRVSF